MSGQDEDGHNEWNRVFGLGFHFDPSQRFQDCLAEVELGEVGTDVSLSS